MGDGRVVGRPVRAREDPAPPSRVCSRHSLGRAWSHRAGPKASLPGTISSSWPASTSTMEVHHCFCGRLRGAVRRNMVSSTPTASTAPIRSSSASNRAAPQRMTSLLMRMPITAQLLGGVGHRPPFPARHLRRPPSGPAGQQPPLRSNPGILLGKPESTPQPLSGHTCRRFRHPSRTGRPAIGRPSRLYQPLALGPHPAAAPRTQPTGPADGADLHQQSPVQGFARLQYLYSPQSGHHLGYALMLALRQGSSSLGKQFQCPVMEGPTPDPVDSPAPSQAHPPPSTLKSHIALILTAKGGERAVFFAFLPGSGGGTGLDQAGSGDARIGMPSPFRRRAQRPCSPGRPSDSCLHRGYFLFAQGHFPAPCPRTLDSPNAPPAPYLGKGPPAR